MEKSELIDEIFIDVDTEFQEALERYPSMNSAHEGYAVILEELDELWEHVRVRQGMRINDRMYKEAIQVAAMAIRFAYDICRSGNEQK